MLKKLYTTVLDLTDAEDAWDMTWFETQKEAIENAQNGDVLIEYTPKVLGTVTVKTTKTLKKVSK